MLRQAGRDAEAQALLPVMQRTYRDVIRRYGTEKQALIAARFLGETYGAQGDWTAGVAVLDSLFTSLGTDARAGTLLLQAARLAAQELGDRERAASLLQRVTTRFPHSDVAVFARGFADSLLAQAPALDGPKPTP
jgi:TolA-binding protein